MADIEHTRRDTRRDPPSRTRREGAPGGSSLVRLPGELAERFTVVGELPAQGAEADLLHVRDAASAELVVKIFRRGFTADRSVWEKLPTLDSPHVVRVLDTGHAEGRDYEVIEYVPEGSLRSVAVEPPQVVEVVSQLAGGLDQLHRAGIVHRDLKPENVLVRGTSPIRLAIADFGLSRVLDQSVVFASSSRTLAYAAPESLSGQVSAARDWWSLGIIVRELLTGRTPFEGMSETAVVDHLATRAIDCDDIADRRMRLLCRGLLIRDPRRRWGFAEVSRWLSGENPAVSDAPPAAGGGLAFGGRTYAGRGELARALAASWQDAARYFFATMSTPLGPSEAWRTLRDWLTGQDGDPEGRIRLIDEHLTGDDPPDVKLLRLLRWLDPAMPPRFLGLRLLPEDLPSLAAIAGDPRHADHAAAARAARLLWERGLLPELAGFEGGDELAAAHDRWRGLAASWDRLAGWLRSQLPQAAARFPDASDAPPVVLTTLLALAGRPAEATEALRSAAARARESVREPVPWFDWLCDQAGDDPLRLLAVVRAAPEAIGEVEGAARHRREAEVRAADGRRHWAAREESRLAGRGRAVLRAILWTLPLAVVWFGGGWLVGQITHSPSVRSTTGTTGTATDPTPLLLLVAIPAFLIDVGAEAALAWVQGGDYLALGPWAWLSRVLRGVMRGLSSASRHMSGATRRGPRGCGVVLVLVPLFLFVILAVTVLSIAWLLWLAVLVVVPLTHAVATGARMQRWRQEHEKARMQALGRQS